MSDRPLAEARLLENEVASVTLDSIGEAVVRTDMFGNVAYTNRIAERMIGWTREEALGRPIADVLRIIDGVSRAAIRNVMEIVIQGGKIANAATNSINCILVRRDGFECGIETTVTPIRDPDGVYRGGDVFP